MTGFLEQFTKRFKGIEDDIKGIEFWQRVLLARAYKIKPRWLKQLNILTRTVNSMQTEQMWQWVFIVWSLAVGLSCLVIQCRKPF